VSVTTHLSRLLALPTDEEAGVLMYCSGVLALGGFTVWRDNGGMAPFSEFGNLYARRGDAPTLCLNAHLDCRHEGIGADDRCGIAAILDAVWAEEDGEVAVLLTTGEEIGGVGAQHVPIDWWQGIGLCASFDRHGNTDIITHYAGRQLAADDVLARVLQVAKAAGMSATPTPSTSMADAYSFADHVPCVNIATGFYDEHSPGEYYITEDVWQAAHVAACLMQERWTL